MPDDFNLFDDDDLTPDWLGDMDDQQPDDATSADTSRTPQDQPGARPAWAVLPGDPAPPPAAPTVTPPWAVLPGDTPAQPSAPRVSPPWGDSGAPPPPPPAEQPPVGPAAGADAIDLDDIDWDAADTDSQAAPAQPTPELGAEDAAWLSSFGTAGAAAGFSDQEQDEDDLAWLAGDDQPGEAAPEPAPDPTLEAETADMDWLFEEEFEDALADDSGTGAPMDLDDLESDFLDDDLFGEAAPEDEQTETFVPPAPGIRPIQSLQSELSGAEDDEFAALEADLFGDKSGAEDEAPEDASAADLEWLLEDDLDAEPGEPAAQAAPAADDEFAALEADIFGDTFEDSAPAEEPEFEDFEAGTGEPAGAEPGAIADMDWLFDADLDAEAAPEAERDSAQQDEPETVPDWVAEAYVPPEDAAEPIDEAPEPQATSRVPEWLQPAAASVAAGDDLIFDFEDQEERDDAEPLPEWLAARAQAAAEQEILEDDEDEDVEEDTLPEWLAARAEAADEEAADENYEDEPEAEENALPEWLAAAQPDTDVAPDEPSAEQAGGIRRIQFGEGGIVPSWVFDPNVEPPDEIPDDMSYEEWEAYHQAREQALQQPEAPISIEPELDSLMPDMPDMPPMPDLLGMDSPGMPEPATPEPDIPDWARAVDDDFDPFTQPFAAGTPEPTEEPDSSDLPDWMSGADDSGEAWDALFGAPAPEQLEQSDEVEDGDFAPASDTDGVDTPSLRRLAPDTPATGAGMDADWLEDDTDESGDLFDDFDALEPFSMDDDQLEPEDEPAPAEVPDWLLDAEPDPARMDAGSAGSTDDSGAGDDDSWDGGDDEPPDLADVFGEFEPEPEDEPAPAEVPDWLLDAEPDPARMDAGSAGSTDDSGAGDDANWDGDDDEPPDLADVFGEFEPEPEDEPAPAEVPDWLLDAEPDPARMDAGSAEEKEPISGDEDALFDETFPDLDALLGERQVPAEPDIPEWLINGTPETTVAEPEDIPFPDLELDQEMPAGDMPRDSFSVPEPEAEPPEDFVERFDPLEPDDFAAPDTPAEPDAGAVPDWFDEVAPASAAEDDFDWPEDLAGEPELEAEPEPAAADAEELDWLHELSPADMVQEDDLFAAEDDLFPLADEFEPPTEPSTEPEPEAEDAFTTAPLDSSALDDLLQTSALTVPEHDLPAPLHDAPSYDDAEADFDALFSELPDDLDAGADQFPAAQEFDAAGREAPYAIPAEPEALDDLFPGEAAHETGAEAEAAERGFFGRFGKRGKRDAEAAPDADDIPSETPEPEPLVDTGEPQPEWVADLRPSELPVKVKAGGVEKDIRQKQIADLPDRLRAFRENTMSGIEAPPPLAPADVGPLAGITGALPLSDAILPRAITQEPVTGLVVTPEQQTRAERLQMLLDTVAAEEEDEFAAEYDEMPALGLLEEFEPDAGDQPAVEPARTPRPARRRARRKPDRLIIVLLLLAALVGPFVTDTLNVAHDPPALEDEQLAVADAIDASVSEGDYVLLAFEYGPAAAGELDQLVDAVLRDILARNAIPLTLSTNPAGALHAPSVIAALADDPALLAARDQEEDALAWGEDYVPLGYVSGEAVGVRSLSTAADDAYAPHPIFEYDLRGDETGLMINDLARDVALLVVIGDESDDVRTWAEQLADVALPKIALVSAAVEPLAVPYVNRDAYAGYLAGARDAYSYNAARNGDTRTPYTMPDNAPDIPNPEDARWHSMALGVLLAAGIISAGLFFNLVRGLLRRRHR